MTLSDPYVVAALVAKLAAISILLANLEYLVARRILSNSGLLSWPVGSLRHAWLVSGWTGRVLGTLLGYPNVLVLISGRIALAVAVLVAPLSLTSSPWLLLPLAFVTVTFYLRSNYGLDGADQMAWLIVAALSLVAIVDTKTAVVAGLWFVALQSCLSYFVSGVAKASARGWRDGTYLPGIFQTAIYGHSHLGHLLATRPALSTALARSVIAWECTFPLVLFAPPYAVGPILLLGVAFHAGNAYLMGLNTFFWSFTATYPAVLYCCLYR
ncbi:hypothetical protein OG625_37245 [Streptomyces sp. NBC_01351]|uniref:hypothetical protein n=1 Tax=Streptomyces sp. NBC_01351 TaxID=2903833 RepID=UPI002E366EB8|nr:hypothetical protein [Streptomyces sp. NBC_01351]